MAVLDDPRIGLTSTVPVEIIYAAGRVPVDLNNILIESTQALQWVQQAEDAGFPRNTCAWIKGIYTAVSVEQLRCVVAVTEGDCAQTHALMEVLRDDGVQAIPFAYPAQRRVGDLERELAAFGELLGADAEALAATKRRLDAVRALAHEIDRLTWQTDQATGLENHLALVNCSDFARDPDAFEAHLRQLRLGISGRPARPREARIGLLGVPPIFEGLHGLLESLGARVVFCEIPRQFAMPYRARNLADQYLRYTYPYGMKYRLADIGREARRRRLDGLIHYVQSFCFRQIGDLLLRRHTSLPVLTIEGDRPGPIDAATRLRIETFVDMLR